MRSARPLGYALASLAAAACFAACAGRGGSPLPPSSGALPQARDRAAAQLPARDLGHRDAKSRVSAVVVLNFRDRAALDRLANDVSDPNSGQFRHFLKPAEFAARFSPTVAQERRVLGALRAAGFTIDRTYDDRAIIDASAASGAAERFFETRIHDFDQGRYGKRYANVTSPSFPASIAPLVASVELDSLVYARAAGGAEADEDDALSDAADAKKPNLILNPGFEGKMKHWESCGRVAPSITGQHPFAGRFDAKTGSKTTTSGDVDGWSSICQKVTIPRDGKLSAYLYDSTNNPSIENSFQAVGLINKPGGTVTILKKSLRNNNRWVRRIFDLSKYAGRSTYIFFGVRGRGQKKFYNTQFVDDVRLTGIVATPTPSPSPSPTPSTSPTPSASPTPTSSPTPSPHPTGPVGPGTDAPLTGPTQGPQHGWAPRGVADGFNFPVQHGYGGTGVTVGIVIDQKANAADLSSFYAYNLITKHGILSYHSVGTQTPAPKDPTEATLDIEGVTGLVPDANVIVYLTADLSNESVIDAYAQALSEKKVSVLNTSFGECESQDSNFVQETDTLATEGAVTGVTFVAAAGDLGSACYNGVTNVIGVNAPASSPHFLGVGGTQSLAKGSIKNPAVWNDRTSGTGVGIGGGGISGAWPLPAFQQGVAGSPSSSTQRNVPDVSFPAVDNDIFIAGTDELVEGTSWSSSIATALIASSEQFCGRVGWVDPAIYTAFAGAGASTRFIDVTTGFNGGYAGNLSQGYSAKTGYDNASGTGMPNGFKFAAALCGRGTSSLDQR
jgi:hypothetical protein